MCGVEHCLGRCHISIPPVPEWNYRIVGKGGTWVRQFFQYTCFHHQKIRFYVLFVIMFIVTKSDLDSIHLYIFQSIPILLLVVRFLLLSVTLSLYLAVWEKNVRTGSMRSLKYEGRRILIIQASLLNTLFINQDWDCRKDLYQQPLVHSTH